MTRSARWVTVLLVALGLIAWPAAAGAKTAKKGPVEHAATPTLIQQGHVTFWECPARTTAVLIGVSTLVLHPDQPLKINFIVRNEATKACNYVAPYAGAAPGPASSDLQVGPCGSMGFEIEGPHHRNVWPGVVTYNCPALGFAQLLANGTALGSGTWSQTTPSGAKRVSPGHYTLVVAGHFSFPITIDAH
jgi:hypothetical protein